MELKRIKCFWYSLLLLAVTSFTLVAVKDSQEFARQLSEILDKNGTTHTGVEVYSLKHDHVVFAHNSNQLFTPASNTKLFVGMWALHALGKEFRYTTKIVSETKVVDGALEGNLYLLPDGDPSFTSEHLEDLIKKIAATGLQTIKGNFYLYNQLFDQECFAPGTTIDDLGLSFFAPIGSLIVDRKAALIKPINTVEFLGTKKLDTLFFDVGSALEALLKKYQITLEGQIGVVQEAPKTDFVVFVEHKSAKLVDLLAHCWKVSDNLYADCFFKRMATTVSREPGSWGKARQVLYEFLKETLHLETSDIKILDGSGLSRYNLVSPHHIVLLLKWAYQQPHFAEMVEDLSIAGVDGTLKDRMLDIANKVKAKTGTMGGISALSGYVETEDDLLAFSILNNGYISTSLYNPPCKNEIEDSICRVLANVKPA